MSQNSYTPTEESTQITSNNDYESIFEEEEEEDEYLEDNLGDARYFPFQDPRDRIILENQRKIQKMQKAFKQTVSEMRSQLAEICEQSTKLQFSMLDRILQLKEKIKEINDRNAFYRRGLQTRNVEKVKRKHTKKKSKTKKRIDSQTQIPEAAYTKSEEPF